MADTRVDEREDTRRYDAADVRYELGRSWRMRESRGGGDDDDEEEGFNHFCGVGWDGYSSV